MENEQMERHEAEILQMSVAEFRELKQHQADQEIAERLGVEPWEIRWRREGRTEEAIASEKQRQWRQIKEIIQIE